MRHVTHVILVADAGVAGAHLYRSPTPCLRPNSEWLA